MAGLKPGDKVRVKDTHGSQKFRGDTGEVEKLVQFGKAYVELDKNGRALVSVDDLEKTSKTASQRVVERYTELRDQHAPFGTVGVLEDLDGPLPRMPRGASRLRLGPGVLDTKKTQILQQVKKLLVRNRGDFNSAVHAAASHAKKTGNTTYVFAGNSFMHAVWRVSDRASSYLNPIDNTGEYVFSVSPQLEITRYEVIRNP